MLRLQPFELVRPSSLQEALQALTAATRAGRAVRLIAGGTDLLPNLKHELAAPAVVISLARLPLSYVKQTSDGLAIGALTSLHEVGESPLVAASAPALGEAARSVAGPQLRRMGTLGGNVCLDTRCRFINQSYFWRSALGFCLKKDGTLCHVVAGGKNCVAALSSDTSLPLLAQGASVVLASDGSERVVPLEQLYASDGVDHVRLEPNEILTEVRVPKLGAREACAFEKLRLRESIDFAVVHLAAHAVLAADGKLEKLRAVVGSLGPKARVVSFETTLGKSFDEQAIGLAAARIEQAVKPLMQLGVDAEWRRAVTPVVLRRALERVQRRLSVGAA